MKGADILVHEAMLTEGIDTLVPRTAGADRLRLHLLSAHTPVEDFGRIASDSVVGRLVLNHLMPADDDAFTETHWLGEVAHIWNGPTTVGRDGLRIPIG